MAGTDVRSRTTLEKVLNPFTDSSRRTMSLAEPKLIGPFTWIMTSRSLLRSRTRCSSIVKGVLAPDPMMIFKLSSSRSAIRFTNMTLARTTPIPTAVIKSTRTVTKSTTTITKTSVRGAWTRCFSIRQSMMSTPTFMRRPAKTARGIFSAKGPRPNNVPSRRIAISMPERGVRPPVRMLATDRMVAPAPGRPPKNPAMIFPMPCPINSRLESC